MNQEHRQLEYGLRFDWGLRGAEAIAAGVDTAVVIDVLSFTTTLSVAADAGIDVLPYSWNDESAVDYARDADAVLAVRRSVAREGQISLSPKTIREAEVPSRLVLPSPNGSTIAFALASQVAECVGASVRNASAVADWIVHEHGPRSRVAIVASGEKWPGGELRPAVEDLWGAGAVVAALTAAGWDGHVSPEARMAADAWAAVSDSYEDHLRDCASGRELIVLGFPHDVAIASELDDSDTVPVLEDRVFRGQRTGRRLNKLRAQR
ncbi:putative 2-phosphosulfolactate phosphatase [Rhodococcus erythropolis]|uniref:2-phosphosulfolactate phosphatase n=1 Tax=Rhodococcus erythropolis TaxID=1833 RepID=UPI000BB3C563|nr:2-phosphosulfolactate phosphatase [Rhodococcus erythropolis]PBI93221.1 putative 2-phosphosulfolactate phosphatase [Rhodococcus erythropolis]